VRRGHPWLTPETPYINILQGEWAASAMGIQNAGEVTQFLAAAAGGAFT